MNILLIYGTYSGGTFHAAEIIADALTEKGHKVSLKNVQDTVPADLAAYSFIIMGTNSWFENKEEGNMNSGYFTLQTKLAEDAFRGKKCALYGLGDSHQYNTTFCKGVDHLSTMVTQHQGTVVSLHRVDRFYFEKQVNTVKLRDWVATLEPLMD